MSRIEVVPPKAREGGSPDSGGRKEASIRPKRLAAQVVVMCFRYFVVSVLMLARVVCRHRSRRFKHLRLAEKARNRNPPVKLVLLLAKVVILLVAKVEAKSVAVGEWEVAWVAGEWLRKEAWVAGEGVAR